MSPDQEAEDRDGEAGARDEAVPERAPAGIGRNELALDAHARKDHDVDRGMRIEPEEMLKEERISSQCRIEESHLEDALDADQAQADRQGRGGQYLDE